MKLTRLTSTALLSASLLSAFITAGTSFAATTPASSITSHIKQTSLLKSIVGDLDTNTLALNTSINPLIDGGVLRDMTLDKIVGANNTGSSSVSVFNIDNLNNSDNYLLDIFNGNTGKETTQDVTENVHASFHLSQAINQVNSKTTTVNGYAAPNKAITITDNGEVVGSGTSDASGQFKITLPRQSWQSQLQIKSETASGTQVTLNKTVMAAAPDKPTVDPVHATDNAIVGHSEPNSHILVTDTEHPHTPVATGFTDANGDFNIRPINSGSLPHFNKLTVKVFYDGQTAATTVNILK